MSTAFLFPGQGSQHVGMGYDLYQRSPEARAVFDQADEQLGFPLSSLCFNGPEDRLTDTSNQQPALFVTSIAAWQAMAAAGWDAPAYVVGHSLGEFSALVAAGSLTFAAGLDLVCQRGQLMKAAGEREPGAMAAILTLETAVVNEICLQASQETGRVVQLANDNCPGQVVISGDSAALARATELAQKNGARKVVRLPISIAAHSPLMAPAAAEFAQAVEEASLEAPHISVIGNVSALPLLTVDDIKVELKAQLTAPVAWRTSMNYLGSQGVDTYVEIGPGEVLLGLMKRIDRKAKRIKFKIGD